MLGKFITHCEDSLTAAVFSNLLHLPTETFWGLLRRACYDNELPMDPGELVDVAAWPTWCAADTCNSSRVVPDLFLRFPAFDLIVEAKRWDHGMQYCQQWKNELIAYANEFGEAKRSVRMIAIGGVHSHHSDQVVHQWTSTSAKNTPNTQDQHYFVCPVHMCRWSTLLLECRRMQARLAESQNPSSRTRADLRILENIIELFAWHGYAAVRWFHDFDFQENLLSENVDANQELYRSLSLQFQNQ